MGLRESLKASMTGMSDGCFDVLGKTFGASMEAPRPRKAKAERPDKPRRKKKRRRVKR